MTVDCFIQPLKQKRKDKTASHQEVDHVPPRLSSMRSPCGPITNVTGFSCKIAIAMSYPASLDPVLNEQQAQVCTNIQNFFSLIYIAKSLTQIGILLLLRSNP